MSFLRAAFRRFGFVKNVDRLLEEAHSKEGLKKSLGALDLVTLGVAGIIGAGIFVLVGEGAATAGVGMVGAFIIAGLICAVAGLAYAELAAAIPASGSGYAYLYTAAGELFGWLVAWALILEYAVGAIAVAIGWSNNFVALMGQIGWDIPYEWSHSPLEPGGIINLPAIAIVLFCTLMLYFGTKESARLTMVLVAIKVAILMLAIGVGFYLFEADNLTSNPMPTDTGDIWGATKAIFAAAAIMFFAYIGFDSVSTTAEETRNPKKDLPWGILGSLAITTLLYILAALALVGAVDWTLFAGDGREATAARGEPFGYIFEQEGIGWAAALIRIGALIGITSVLLVLILGGVRVFFNMSRDGLLPRWMATVHPRFGTPARTTMLYGGLTLSFAGFFTLGRAVELVNIGTLFAFLMVIIAVMVFRRRRPDVPRPFRMRGVPVLNVLGGLAILALIFSLGDFTLVAFVTWTGIGLLLYALYGVRHSVEMRERAGLEPTKKTGGAGGTGGAPKPRASKSEGLP